MSCNFHAAERCYKENDNKYTYNSRRHKLSAVLTRVSIPIWAKLYKRPQGSNAAHWQLSLCSSQKPAPVWDPDSRFVGTRCVCWAFPCSQRISTSFSSTPPIKWFNKLQYIVYSACFPPQLKEIILIGWDHFPVCGVLSFLCVRKTETEGSGRAAPGFVPERPSPATAAVAGQCCHLLSVVSCHWMFPKCTLSTIFIRQYTHTRGDSRVETTVNWHLWTGHTLHFLILQAGRKMKDMHTKESEKNRQHFWTLKGNQDSI